MVCSLFKDFFFYDALKAVCVRANVRNTKVFVRGFDQKEQNPRHCPFKTETHL